MNKLYCRPGRAKEPVLKAVSFALSPGDALGVIGPSASGKSTLARALVGVERPVSGDARLDGADVLHWDRGALGKSIGYLSQDVTCFQARRPRTSPAFRTMRRTRRSSRRRKPPGPTK